MKRTFKEFRLSRIPAVLGRCQKDVPFLLSILNEAIERLVNEDSDLGFKGLIQRMAFSVVNNFVTTPANVARITDITVCSQPIRIQNQAFEYLLDGDGLKPANACDVNSGPIEAHDRGTVPIITDLPSGNSYLRLYPGNSGDVGQTMFFNALDQNGLTIRSVQGQNMVNGFSMTLAIPFVTSTFTVSKLSAISKAVTLGDVSLYAVDPTTGGETLLSRFGAEETSPEYRRYYLVNLPKQCCNAVTPVQVIGLAKLDFVPVKYDTDFLMISNFPALKEELMAIHYSEMDSQGSAELSAAHHREAIRLLNNELRTFEGPQTPAISVAVHGTAHLWRQGIGRVI